MTPEEALKQALSTSPFNAGNRNGEYLQAIIDSLEKQIPKRPIGRCFLPDEIDTGACPVCAEVVNQRMGFCERCGQAILWDGNR